MGNKLCITKQGQINNPSKFEREKNSNNHTNTSSKFQTSLIPEAPYFMDQQLYTIFLTMKQTIFQGIQSSYNGIQVTGNHIDSWVPAGQSLMYKGQWMEEKKHGKGLLYLQIQRSLIGGCFYQDHLLLNKCRKIYSNGTIYLGSLNIVYEMHGVGKVIGKTFTYEGNLKNDRFDGKGKLQRQSENYCFKGKFKNGLKSYGIQKTLEGIYQGPFRNKQRQGQGVFKWRNGGRYEGPFSENKMHGVGKLFDTQGNYCGQHRFQQGKRILQI